MPQIIPFFFVNQISFTFLTIFILLFVFSKFILPSILEIQIIRMFIIKL